MDNKKDQHTENQDFTSKGRTNNADGGEQTHDEHSADISNIDQQEGELSHGTTAKDDELFSSGKNAGAAS